MLLFVHYLNAFSKIGYNALFVIVHVRCCPTAMVPSRRRKEHGFLKGCKDVGNNEDTCQSAEEDNQDLKRVAN